jgi:hypothetical protein
MNAEQSRDDTARPNSPEKLQLDRPLSEIVRCMNYESVYGSLL